MVSNGAYTVNTGTNGIRIFPGIPSFGTVFPVYRYSGLFFISIPGYRFAGFTSGNTRYNGVLKG